jgi:hypothetical protein
VCSYFLFKHCLRTIFKMLCLVPPEIVYLDLIKIETCKLCNFIFNADIIRMNDEHLHINSLQFILFQKSIFGNKAYRYITSPYLILYNMHNVYKSTML